jgi:hypothetical protein
MSIQEINEAWKLLRALKSKEKFAALTLDEKLEALRLHSIQTVGHKEEE